jgi:DNA-binding beta-propeller fold protein YncE
MVLVGCGAPTSPPRAEGTRAAEPAVAPPLTVRPAGRSFLVGAAAEGVVADPVTHVVAVGTRDPDQLVLADSRTGRITRRVLLPGHLRHLQLAAPGGPVLVPDENSGAVLTVALPSGEVTARVRTGVSPHDATRAGNGLVFAADEAGGKVAVIRGDKVVHTFTDVVQPAGLAAVGTTVGLVDVRQNTLHLYDAVGLKATARLPAGAGPTHLVADRHGRLVVVDTRGNAVLIYRLTPTPVLVARLPLPGTPYGVAYYPAKDRLWVTLTATNQVAGITLGASGPRVIARLPTVRQPDTVAVDSATGRLYVTGTHDGVLQILGPVRTPK